MTEDVLTAGKNAEDARPLIDPENGWNIEGARALAKVAARVHGTFPGIWSIHGDKQNPCLNVGNIVVFSLYAGGRIGMAIRPTSLSSNLLAKVEALETGRRYKDDPEIVFIRSQGSDDVLDLFNDFGDAQWEVVERKAGYWKRNIRWRWHDEELVRSIEKIGERPIPQPGYSDELAELRAQSESDRNDSSESLVFQYSASLLERMADSVRLAHAIDPNSWSVFETNGRVALNVGQRTVGGSAVAGMYDFIVHDGDLDDDLRAAVEPYRNADLKPGFSKEEPLRFLRFPVDIDASLIETLAQAHETALRVLVTPGSRANLWDKHREDLRQQIEKATDEPLPVPGYAGQNPQELRHVCGRRYWAFMPVYTGKQKTRRFDMGRDQSVVGIDTESWQGPMDLSTLPSDRVSFLREIRTIKGYGHMNVEQPWRLVHEMMAGDCVVLYRGNRARLWGHVSGPYRHAEWEEIWQHQRPVRWEIEINRAVEELPAEVRDKRWSNGRADPLELTPQQFATAIGATLVDDVNTGPLDTSGALNTHFALRGLSYTSEQVATFYTALQTKGFVVLSGISGTGKSKIAQHFVELLPEPAAVLEDVEVAGLLKLKRMPVFPKLRLVTLPAKQIDDFQFPDKKDSWPVRAQMEGEEAEGTLTVQWVNGNRLVQLRVDKGTVANLIAALPEDGRFYGFPEIDAELGRIAAIEFFRVPPARLPNGHHLPMRPGSNHLFLAVRPDWRDSTSLLGYFNPLTQRYQWTDFLHFLLRAVRSYEQRDGLAWFVILDEMNLAHVEYYFADLLSVIESGRQGPHDRHPGFSREPLRITYGETMDDDVPPREVFLPPNLYIIGTVNMDETTHAFSPKVLDRAFTIELAEVDFANYPPSPNGDTATVPEDTKRAMLAAFTRNGRFHQINKADIADLIKAHPEVRDRLQRLNRALTEYRFQFGYRIFDEICQYLANNDANGMAKFDEAFDAAVYMKVLPKFTGSEARLRGPLRALFAWAVEPDTMVVSDVNANAAALASLVEDAKVRRVAWRAHQMIRTLETDGFVSFG